MDPYDKISGAGTISGAVHSAEEYLRMRGVEDAATDAWYLLEYASGRSRASLLAKLRDPVPEEWRQSYLELIRARGDHVPLQYLTGEQEFMGLNFRVTPDVLIPRQDTETLVEEALAWLKKAWPARTSREVIPVQEKDAVLAEKFARVENSGPKNSGLENFRSGNSELENPELENSGTDNPGTDEPESIAAPTEEECPHSYRILDLCTGSGCIAISLAKLWKPEETVSHPVGFENLNESGELPLQIVASDLSAAALAVARENAERLGAAVTFMKSDLFAGFHSVQPFDLIVSNPPYVTAQEMETLDEEVRLHEPRTALCGGDDGLVYYRKIIMESRKYLRPQGCLMFEIGCGQVEAVTELMRENGFSGIRVKQDLAGKDRVVTGTLGCSRV